MGSTLTGGGWVVDEDIVDERLQLPRMTGAQITAMNTRIAAGSREYPVGTKVIRIDDGAEMTLRGLASAASFQVEPPFVVSADAPNNADGRPDGTIYIQTA